MQKIKNYLKSKKHLVVVLAAVIAGIGVGYALKDGHSGSTRTEGHQQQLNDLLRPAEQGHAALLESEIQKADTVYICPMNCVPPMEKPGKCPVCGMDLVAVSAQEHRHEEDRPRVKLADEVVKAAGIQVAPVERKAVTAEIRLFGKIEYDPVHQYKVTAFAPGVIDSIYVKRAGQMVRAGDPLFDMHSSELFVLEQDLFEVLKEFPDVVDYRPARGLVYKRQMKPPRRQFNIPKAGEAPEEVVEAKQAAFEKLGQIQRKMGLLGLTKENIERIMARGLPSGISTVITPTTGIVLEQSAFKGAYVNTGDAVFTIANPQYVWAKFDAYASDFPWIKLGQEAEFRSDAYPGEIFKGKVIYLDPYFDEKTRTFKVGVLCTDHGGKLKPAMLVRGAIYATLSSGYGVDVSRSKEQKTMLVIPDTAPLITGKRAVVYVELPGKPGTYEGREVLLGPRAEGYYVVREGLQEGEKVVVNGNFKIDSAIQILAKASMMEHGGRSPMLMHHDHGGSPMVDQQPDGSAPMEMKPAVEMPAMGRQIQNRTEKMQLGTPATSWDNRSKKIE